jgi:hypothetical protein
LIDAGSMPCADASCDLNTTFCAVVWGNTLRPPFVSNSNSPGPPTCLARPSCWEAAVTCDCLGYGAPASGCSGQGNGETCWMSGCSVDDAGVVYINSEVVGPCYGSPPARLERLTRALS